MRFKAEPGVRLLSTGNAPGVPVAVETMWSIPVIAWDVAIHSKTIYGTREIKPVVPTDDGPRVVDQPCPLMFEDGSIRAYRGELRPDNTVKLHTVMFPSLSEFIKAMRGNTWEI